MSQLKKRYLISVIANIIRGGITLLTSAFLARGLGPTEFGRFSFLLVTFTAIKGIIELGTSSVFFTLISQRQRTSKFVFSYFLFIALQFFIFSLIIFILLPQSILTIIWGSENKFILFIAFLASFVQGIVWNLAAQMAEASKQSLKLQKVNTLLLIIYFLGILIAWHLNILTIKTLFYFIIIEWAVASFFAFRLYKFSSKEIQTSIGINSDNPKSVLSEFLNFGVPLFLVSIITFFHDSVDRILLQRWGGSVDQGYFSIAQQFSIVSLIATTSILRIFWKEISEAYHNNIDGYVQILFLKTSRYLYVFSCIISGFLIQFVPELIRVTIGTQYIGAETVFIIMFLYPVHQSLGQLTTTLLLSTGKTKIYAKIIVISMVISLAIIPFIVGSGISVFPGLKLGAVGLAFKYLIIQFLTVNSLLYFISKEFGWKFDWLYQFHSVIVFITIGFLSKYIYSVFFHVNFSDLINISFVAVIYLIISGLYIFLFPELILLTRIQIINKFKLLISEISIKNV